MTPTQEKAILILKENLSKTKWNFYSSVQLMNESRITRTELNWLFVNGHIKVSQGMGCKLISLIDVS
jgi:hypothetical protein